MYSKKQLSFDGVEMHYSVNNSSKYCVVFIHGDGQNHTAGLPILESFPDEYTKISIDRPGHGKSSSLAARTINKECELLEAILQKENITEPIIIGHSSGSAIASSYATQRKVRSLVLINPFFVDPRKILWYLPVQFLEKITFLNKAKGKYEQSLGHEFGNETSEEEIHERMFRHTPPYILKENLDMLTGYDVRESMKEIESPVLILQSEKDFAPIRNHARKVMKNIPISKLEIISGSHNIHLLSKEEVKEKIKRSITFLSS